MVAIYAISKPPSCHVICASLPDSDSGPNVLCSVYATLQTRIVHLKKYSRHLMLYHRYSRGYDGLVTETGVEDLKMLCNKKICCTISFFQRELQLSLL